MFKRCNPIDSSRFRLNGKTYCTYSNYKFDYELNGVSPKQRQSYKKPDKFTNEKFVAARRTEHQCLIDVAEKADQKAEGIWNNSYIDTALKSRT